MFCSNDLHEKKLPFDFQEEKLPLILLLLRSPPPLMNHRFSDRRILKFPAVHPCSNVSASTLISDLSNIAGDIYAFRCSSEFFATHRRAARESLRQAGLLLAFLDDVRSVAAVGAAATLPSAAMLGLSDLHVTLQKLRLILADCTRGGTRLLILMNAGRVAGEFASVFRSIGTALDVLPLDAMDLSKDSCDLIRLLACQAKRIEVGIEAADDLAVRSVRSILGQFVAGDSPNHNEFRRILQHLKINTWVDCFEEIAFLEEEIIANENACETAVLWSLMGLMIYSLAELFDPSPDVRKRRLKEYYSQQDSAAVDLLNADGLRCPISLELMKDPVTVTTGQTYDRTSILRWLNSGNQTCPVTGEKLTSSDLVPNSAIRNLIGSYRHENCLLITKQEKHNLKRDLSKTLFPASSAAVGAIRMAAVTLARKLSSAEADEHGMAAYAIRVLSKSNIFNRICFIEAGAIQWLLFHLSSPQAPVQENAVAALLNLSKHPSARTEISEAGGVKPVVEAMKTALKVEAKQNAAAILFYISSVKVSREAIGEIPEAILALVEMVKNGTYRGKKNAILTLYGLLLSPSNQAKILAADTIPAIADLLSAEEDDLVSDCAGVLAKLAETPDGSVAITRSSAAAQLVHLLRTSASRSGKEHAVAALLSLCKNGGEKTMKLLENMPLLMPALYSFLGDGSPQACKKARSLLYHIHQFQDRADRPGLGLPPVHGPVVPVL
ncbi:U-box domain-containing protein 19 [Apostasia shenzhenica]|uniref:RING-type E3 ubiquitin transferase n=1 Tax=Apostasia shenzhenica TaxID=1088818 RepID=A0A2I0B584_9ASPA|nr:U-box domain-containing protein 19 [Apostasia shenzhenica]